MKTKNKMLEKARKAKRESMFVEFKERCDINSKQNWCELIKDIVAIANSGGGIILIGVKNNGMPSGFDAKFVLNIDPAKLTDKIVKYTGEQFSELEIEEIDKNGHKIAVLLIHYVPIPMIFINPGTYETMNRKQKRAFGRGTVYFRHGAKSEPGNSNDLRRVIERELEKIRKSWLGNIRRVVRAPVGSHVQVLPPRVVESDLPNAVPIRVVEDPNAPAYRKVDYDHTHPYRQKKIIELVNQRLGNKKTVNSYDILSVRKVHKIHEKPEYYHKPKYSTPQYSEDFVDWLVKQYERDPSFFEMARQKYRQLMDNLKRMRENTREDENT